MVTIEHLSRHTVLTTPDGNIERNILVLAAQRAVETHIHRRKRILHVQVETVGQIHTARRRRQAVAVLRRAVVVGIVVGKHLAEPHRVVASVHVAAHALSHRMHNRVFPLFRSFRERISHRRCGMSLSRLVSTVRQERRRILKTAVIPVQRVALLVEHGIFVLCGQCRAEEVRDGHFHRSRRVALAVLPCGHSLVVGQHRGGRGHESHVPEFGRSHACAPLVHQHIVQMPVVAVAGQARLAGDRHRTEVPEPESKTVGEEGTVGDCHSHILPVPARSAHQRVHLRAAAGPYGHPCAVSSTVELQHQRIARFRRIANAQPQVAFAAARQVVETQHHRVGRGQYPQIDGLRAERVGSEQTRRGAFIQPSVGSHGIQRGHPHRRGHQAGTVADGHSARHPQVRRRENAPCREIVEEWQLHRLPGRLGRRPCLGTPLQRQQHLLGGGKIQK